MHTLSKPRSKERRALIAAIVAVVFVGLLASFSISPAIADDELKEVATLTGEHQKQQFALGERVEITKANVGDDIFAMGRDIVFDNVSGKKMSSQRAYHIL